MNYRDIAVRAAKTAVQTFLGVASVAAVMSADVSALENALAAAAAAALSVLWNAALEWANS